MNTNNYGRDDEQSRPSRAEDNEKLRKEMDCQKEKPQRSPIDHKRHVRREANTPRDSNVCVDPGGNANTSNSRRDNEQRRPCRGENKRKTDTYAIKHQITLRGQFTTSSMCRQFCICACSEVHSVGPQASPVRSAVRTVGPRALETTDVSSTYASIT